MADAGSTVKSVRSSTRKKRTPMTLEEDDGGFLYTRRSKRLRRENPSPIVSSTNPKESTKKLKRERKVVRQKDKVEDVIEPRKDVDNIKDNVELSALVEEEKDVEQAKENNKEGVVAMLEDIAPDEEDKQESQDTGPSEGKEQETQKTKPKRRRSFFQRGRKPRSSLEMYDSETLSAIRGLHKEIPLDLSSDKRYLLLTEKSVQIMSENIKNCDSIPDFAEKAEEFISCLQISVQNSCSLKTSTKSNAQDGNSNKRTLIPNPKNAQLEKFAKESAQTTKRMLQEDKKWEDLLLKYQEKNIPLERKPNHINKNNLQCLSSEQQEFLNGSLPLEKVTENLQTSKLKALIMIDKVCETTGKLNAFNSVAKDFIEKNVQLLGTKAFEGVPETPRQLIKGTVGLF